MYLLIGAGGFLGSYVIKHIIEDTSDGVIAATGSGQVYLSDNDRVIPVKCDVCNAEDRRCLAEISGSYSELKVIYLCAQHNIDIVASQPDAAYAVNITALKNLVLNLNNVKCLFFASSDTVYGEGGNVYFKEADRLNPVSVYGHHKALGEQIVLSCGYNVLRLPFMFSRSLSPYKKHFCDELIRRFLSGECADMYTDSIRSALSFDKVAEIFVSLCEGFDSGLPEVLNVAGDEALSKYDIGLRLAKSLGADERLAVPVKSAGTWQPGAQRAVSTLMDNSLLKKCLNTDKLIFNII